VYSCVNPPQYVIILGSGVPELWDMCRSYPYMGPYVRMSKPVNIYVGVIIDL